MLIKAIETGILPHVDTHPPFRDLLKHRAYVSRWLHEHLRLPHTSFTFLSEPFEREQAVVKRDTWQLSDDELVRVHVNPRSTLFIPTPAKCPIDLALLSSSRHTFVEDANGRRFEVKDCWQDVGAQSCCAVKWVGRTVFKLFRDKRLFSYTHLTLPTNREVLIVVGCLRL